MSTLENKDAVNAYAPIEQPEQIKFQQSPEDEIAARIVIQDMQRAESYAMQRTFQIEYDEAAILYTAPQKLQVWPGTDLPRSSVSVPLVSTHVNAIVPQLMGALFSGEPPFDFEPRSGTKADTARAAADLVSWEITAADVKSQFDQGIRAMCLFGSGVWRWGWQSFTEKVTTYRFKNPPLTIPAPGGDMHVLTEDSDELEAVETEKTTNRPTFEYIDTRHILVDPACAHGDIRSAKFVIHRQYLTANDLDKLRDFAGYNIPDRDTLRSIFLPPKEQTYSSPLETLPLPLQREFAPTPRWEATSADPLEQPIEVLERWDHQQVITILNRKVVIRNERHDFGTIPFLSCNFADIPGSFYGLGIARLIGPEQRVQGGIINARIDELALNLMGTYVRRRGTSVPSENIVLRPGGVIEEDDPDAFKPLPRTPAVPEAFAEVEASEARAERSSGASELVVQGSLPTHGRSSITRTATGASTLAQAAGARLEYLVDKIAHQVLEPMLKAFWSMSRRYLKPTEVQRILSVEFQQAYTESPLDFFNLDGDFTVLAASKMSAKRALAQALPLLFGYLLSGPLPEQLSMQGEKVNVGEAVNLLFDATGYQGRQSLIVPMTPQDEQTRAAASPMTAKIAAQQHATQASQQAQAQRIAQLGANKLKAIQAKAHADIQVAAANKQMEQQPEPGAPGALDPIAQKAYDRAQRLVMQRQLEAGLTSGEFGEAPGIGEQ